MKFSHLPSRNSSFLKYVYLDLSLQERPPPVPPSRNYTITGNSKLSFPQTRVMKMNFPEDTITNPPTEQLKKGESVNVVGASSCRGHLIVEHKGQNFHVPFQYMELLRGMVSNASATSAAPGNNTIQSAANNNNNTCNTNTLNGGNNNVSNNNNNTTNVAATSAAVKI